MTYIYFVGTAGLSSSHYCIHDGANATDTGTKNLSQKFSLEYSSQLFESDLPKVGIGEYRSHWLVIAHGATKFVGNTTILYAIRDADFDKGLV